MRHVLTIAILILSAAAVIAAGCMSGPATPQASKGDPLLAQGENEFLSHNYHAAEALFIRAQQEFLATGDAVSARKARDRAATARMMTSDFPYNRSTVERMVAGTYPTASPALRAAWLDGPMNVTLKSDGETWYFSGTMSNILNHNFPLMRQKTAAMNHTPIYDEVIPLVATPWKAGAGPYGEPVSYEGLEELSFPRDALPRTGTFRLWIPLPIETDSQTNVTIVSVGPAKYAKYTSGTDANLGLGYFEVPLEEETGPFINLTARFRFDQHEQRFSVDPARVKAYNTTSPLYLMYTAPGRNTVITPEMKNKALEIVGNETNPYLRAQMIYQHITTTLPYSKAPHAWLDASGTPESAYVLSTGIGDCGSQSTYFTALCRSIGIPARAVGGYQMITGTPGTHFWAEYYLEGYGWVPVDVTAEDSGDWSHNATPDQRKRFKEYYFGSLDPYRYVIQTDTDIPFTPATNDPVSQEMYLQEPRGVCDTCPENPNLFIPEFSTWKVTFSKR